MLTLSADGRQLWTGNRFGSSVIVIDTTSGNVVRTITVESAPHGITYFPQPGHVSIGHNGYIANAHARALFWSLCRCGWLHAHPQLFLEARGLVRGLRGMWPDEE